MAPSSEAHTWRLSKPSPWHLQEPHPSTSSSESSGRSWLMGEIRRDSERTVDCGLEELPP
eukprot:8280555-Pyramimonas_sp.AAC.1